MHRICGRKHHRASIPVSNPSEYFRRTITVPILDHLHSKLDKRFSSHKKKGFQGLYLVPSVFVQEDHATMSSVVMKEWELYAIDLPNVYTLSSDIHNWYTMWKSEENDHGSNSLSSTLSSSLTRISSF